MNDVVNQEGEEQKKKKKKKINKLTKKYFLAKKENKMVGKKWEKSAERDLKGLDLRVLFNNT